MAPHHANAARHASEIDHVRASLARMNRYQLEAAARRDLFACPYVCRGLPYHDAHGTCVFGCYDEPACITGGPPDLSDYCAAVEHAWDQLGRLVASSAWPEIVAQRGAAGARSAP